MSTSTTTLFRRAIRDAVASAAGIETVVERKIDDALVDASAVCSWPDGWRPNGENRHFRVYVFTVRILLPADPAVGPLEDERADLLEHVAEHAVAALPLAPSIEGVSGAWIYEVVEVAFDLDRVSVDFVFEVELEDPLAC